jgi:hypothetical protein
MDSIEDNLDMQVTVSLLLDEIRSLKKELHELRNGIHDIKYPNTLTILSRAGKLYQD